MARGLELTMLHEFVYPVTLTPDEEDGGLVATFEDIPEAITQGETQAEALAQAADALEEAIAGRILGTLPSCRESRERWRLSARDSP